MFSEVQKRGKLVREVGGSKDKTNGRERDALSWHFLSRPLPGVPFWPSPIISWGSKSVSVIWADSLGDSFFTTTGADAAGRITGKRQYWQKCSLKMPDDNSQEWLVNFVGRCFAFDSRYAGIGTASWSPGICSFSLRSCRSSSVKFLWFFAGKFGKFSGKFGGNFPGFFSDPQNKGSKISGKISEHFS